MNLIAIEDLNTFLIFINKVNAFHINFIVLTLIIIINYKLIETRKVTISYHKTKLIPNTLWFFPKRKYFKIW